MHCRPPATLEILSEMRTKIVFKIWVKSTFVLSKPRYNNLLNEKKGKKFTFVKHSFLENILLLSSLRNSLQIPSSDLILVKFYIVKFSYFSGRPNKVKERF